MKIDSKLIEIADKAICPTDNNDNSKRIVQTDGLFDNRFKGYISSFGASIVQSGLLPTVIFFEQSSDKAEKRDLIILALKRILNEYYSYNIDGKLYRYILEHFHPVNENNQQNNNHDNYHAFEEDVTICMVAMKLALRMYQSDKKTENKHV